MSKVKSDKKSSHPGFDRLHRFLLADKAVRGALVQGTGLVRAMRQAHGLGILETLVLGHACLGTLLASSSLKGRDRMGLQIDCSGPIQGLVAEADAEGFVRGYLKQVPIPIDKPLESFDLAPFFGAGFLTLTRFLEDAKQPFAGKSMLQYGNLAQDLANHYLTSEQLPTVFNLSVQFDQQGEVAGAGGLFLQAMPASDEQLMVELEKRVTTLPSIGAFLAEGGNPESFVREKFSSFSPKMLPGKAVFFRCRCNTDRLRGILMSLPVADLDDILEKDTFPLEMRCHFCSRIYAFGRRDVESIRASHLATH